jgi:hypothetical protein
VSGINNPLPASGGTIFAAQLMTGTVADNAQGTAPTPVASPIGTQTAIGGQYILPTTSTNIVTGVVMDTTTDLSLSNRFNTGTRSVSAGINIPSLDTADGGPVVSVIRANRTQIFTQPLGTTGNLEIR